MSGTLVACIESPMSKEFVVNLKRPVVTYGVHEGDFRAEHIAYGEKTSFSLTHGDTELLQLETTQLGEHNIQNIIGVAALLLTLGLVTPEHLRQE